ncbi:hypothetical protein SELMODRAFT_430163 [Selaginella moellendorffii]|uniref:Uncharacterized protein n=1 Tax=Selaginella moellendorffii TaxID=88036 RepID=D8T8J4_SELML|nr:hypothetical protein SELMODRAFT_430163 [Selaginella moellendorffii]
MSQRTNAKEIRVSMRLGSSLQIEHEVCPRCIQRQQTLWFLREDAVDTACRHSRLPSRNLCPGYGRSGKSPDPTLNFESDQPVHITISPGRCIANDFLLVFFRNWRRRSIPPEEPGCPGPKLSQHLDPEHPPALPSSSRICHVQAPGHLGLSLGQHDDGFSRKLGELVSKQMVGVYVIIWIRKNLCRHVHGLKVCCVGCGILWKQGKVTSCDGMPTLQRFFGGQHLIDLASLLWCAICKKVYWKMWRKRRRMAFHSILVIWIMVQV